MSEPVQEALETIEFGPCDWERFYSAEYPVSDPETSDLIVLAGRPITLADIQYACALSMTDAFDRGPEIVYYPGPYNLRHTYFEEEPGLLKEVEKAQIKRLTDNIDREMMEICKENVLETLDTKGIPPATGNCYICAHPKRPTFKHKIRKTPLCFECAESLLKPLDHT